MKTYIVRASDKMNNDYKIVERDSLLKAINTAVFYVKRGAAYCIIEKPDYERIAWVEMNGLNPTITIQNEKWPNI